MRSGFAMRALAAFGLSLAALWVSMPAAAQNIVVVLDPDTDLENEDFVDVDSFEGDLFTVVETLEAAAQALRANPALGELWLVRKDDCGAWDEVFPTLGGEDDDAIQALTVRGFPFDEPWRVIVQGNSNAAAIEIVSVPSTDILIEGITVRGGDPAVLITTPSPGNGDNGNGGGSVILDRTIIREANGDGIEVSGEASANIYNTAIYESGGDGVYVGPDATIEMEYVSILANSGVGLYADGAADFETAVAFSLAPTDDATIDEEEAVTNFGGDPELRVRTGGDEAQVFRTEAVLTFENPALTAIDSIESATLVLHDTREGTDTADAGVTTVSATEPGAALLPCASCLTWNNAPIATDALDAQLYAVPGGSTAFDVAAAFESACAAFPCDIDQRVTLRVSHQRVPGSPVDGLPPLFASSDNPDASLHPVISLVYVDDNGDTVTLLLPVDVNVPGPEDEPIDCGCAISPLQEFPGDTIIREETPDIPAGEEDASVLAITAAEEDVPGQRSALLQFLIEDLEPGKAVSAELRLVATEFPADTTISLFAAADPRPPIDTLAVEDGFWDEADIAWGDDNEPTAVRLLGEFTVASAIVPGNPQLITFDVTPWVQGNGAVSFRIESDSDEDDQTFSSKEGDSPPELFFLWEEDADPFDEEDDSPVRINNSLVWDNGDGAFFEVKPGTIQQGGGSWSEDEPEDTATMHVDFLGEIFDREPGPTASDPRVALTSPNCSATFPGRIIDDEDNPSPLLERGVGLPAGFNLDLDFDVRPSTGADIGADQLVSIAAGPISWFYSAVTPPPGCFSQRGVIGDPVGEIAAGDLRVEVRVRSDVPGVNALPDEVFILPQDLMRFLAPSLGGGPLTYDPDQTPNQLTAFDGTPILPDQTIRLNRQAAVSGTNAVWIGTNAAAISTRLLAGPGNGGAFAAGDTFADGHGIVMLAYGPEREVTLADPSFNVVGDEGPINAGLNTLDEEGAIIDQALIGRHVLIDTIPPRFNFEEFGPNPTAANFLGDSNDILLPGNLPGDTHPFPGPPATGPGIIGLWPTAVDLVPSDSGALADSSFAPPRAGPGGALFFNHASRSNRSGLEPTEAGGIPGTFSTLEPALNALRMRLQVLFTDVTVEEFHGIVHTEDTDPFNVFTNSSVRPIAGFRESIEVPFGISFQTTVEELLQDATDDLFPLLWGYAPDSRRFVQDTPVEVTYGVTDRDALDSAGNLGSVLDFEALRGGNFETGNQHVFANIVGDWHFTPDSAAAPLLGSIGFEEHIRNNHFVARLLFRGRDAACNLTPTALDERNMGPLNLWWMINTDTRMTRHTDLDDIELGEANFDWELSRGYAPRAIGQPQPLFTYRFYAATTNNPDGPYAPITPWSGWRQERSGRPMITAEEFESFAGPAFYDNWIMIVAIGVDEAGNVTQWPWQDWVGDPDVEVIPIGGQRERANWLRLRITREQTARVRLGADFWWQPVATLGLPGVSVPELARLVPKRPPEGADVYRSVVPLPAITSPQVVYARFTINLSGIPDNLGPDDEVIVLFDLRRHGNQASLVEGGNIPALASGEYGVGIRVPQQTRRLELYLPISGGRAIAIAPEVFPGGFDSVAGTRSPFAAAFTFEDSLPQELAEYGPVLGDLSRQSSIEYVARATVWIDPEGLTYLTGAPLGDRAVQAKPENLRFTVVPDASRTQFFRPRYSPDDQPIRVREQQ